MTLLRDTLATLAALALAGALTACGDPSGGQPGEAPPAGGDVAGDGSPAPSEDADTVPFWLDVSNQSFEVPEVRLVVRVDGDVVVDEVFDVGTQHNWKRFELALPAGAHEVTAEAPEHGQTFSERLTLEGERWATLSYWGEGNDASGRVFSWVEHDRPPAYA